MKTMTTEERIRELLIYDPETGSLKWAVTAGGRIRSGEIAGGPTLDGYRRINILSNHLKEHRVAWFLYHGRWPVGEIDHINGVKSDNRISNLRDCTSSQNKHNCSIRSDNTSGIKGVKWDKSRNKWMAGITLNGKLINLGRFLLKEDAEKAVIERRSNLHGDFARNN